MVQQTISVYNDSFWEALEDLNDQTYRQGVALDEKLFEILKESADECKQIGEYDYLLSWNSNTISEPFTHETPQRTIVLAKEQREQKFYYKALLVSINTPWYTFPNPFHFRDISLGFKHAEYNPVKEFLFVAED